MMVGQRLADNIAQFAGSWKFIIGFIAVLDCWIEVNCVLAPRTFDPYPSILLKLLLSCVAAIQVPLIMMSQNRIEEKDRKRAENDYLMNLKAEIIIQDLHTKLDRLLENQEKVISSFDENTTWNKKEINKSKKGGYRISGIRLIAHTVFLTVGITKLS